MDVPKIRGDLWLRNTALATKGNGGDIGHFSKRFPGQLRTGATIPGGLDYELLGWSDFTGGRVFELIGGGDCGWYYRELITRPGRHQHTGSPYTSRTAAA